MFKAYLLQNWPLILVLLAFAISLFTTVFFEKKMITRLYFLVGSIFLLSIIVFLEFYWADLAEFNNARLVMIALRYSATPLLIALICLTLIKKMRWFIFIPALLLVVLNIISIFTGIVFSIDPETSKMVHGPIWLIPYIFVGLYSVFLITLLIKRSNKRLMEILPIAFFAFALGSGLVLPFILGADYAPIFCSTIAIALFAYYEFSILQLVKKDSLTGLLNRHAYFADINNDPKSITALISLDMNGLKTLNDNEGHATGDEALVTLALCFTRPLSNRQSAYRIGGDEFIIVCRKTFKDEVLKIVERIKKSVSETDYTCSIGYSFNFEGDKTITELLKESDKMMYEEKKQFYLQSGTERRKK